MDAPSFSSLPREFLTKVFGWVAVSSYIDLYNTKLCCKEFLEAAEEECILQNVSLESFPVIPEWNKQERVSKFLDKCLEKRNPEALFRKGVVDYFGGKDPNHAVECLDEASRSGHEAASYALAMVLIFKGGESKKKGIRLLSDQMKRSRIKKKTIRHCRERVKNIISEVWIKNEAVLGYESQVTCCTVHRSERRRRSGWDMNNVHAVEDDDDRNIRCDGCACDQEIRSVFDVYDHQFVH